MADKFDEMAERIRKTPGPLRGVSQTGEAYDVLAQTLRDVQRKTAQIIVEEIIPEVRENWCGKLPDKNLKDAIWKRFGLKD